MSFHRIHSYYAPKAGGGGGGGHGVGIPTPRTAYLFKSINIPHPQGSKGQLYTSNRFKFPHPWDTMYNQNSYPRDMTHNQISVGSPTPPPLPHGLNIDKGFVYQQQILMVFCMIFRFQDCLKVTTTPHWWLNVRKDLREKGLCWTAVKSCTNGSHSRLVFLFLLSLSLGKGKSLCQSRRDWTRNPISESWSIVIPQNGIVHSLV